MTYLNRSAALGFAAAVLATSGIAGTANAQAIKGQTYDEIVVTAQRSEENVQDVPIAVTAFSSENLEMQQIEAFSDLQFNTPNMTFTKGNFTGVNMTIRGVSSATVAASGDSGVSFHINEAPLPTRVFEIEYYDLQRVEVLRGPQGTLFGRNATGGVVNMVTARPTQEFEADIEIETGEYNHFKTKGMLNMPLTEKLALRVAGITLQRDGFTKNLYDGTDIDDRDIFSYRGTLSYDFDEDTSAWVMYSKFDENDKRARIGRQMCAPTSAPALGCDPNVIAYGGGPGGASTLGGLYGAHNGLLPYDPASSSFTMITDPRSVITPFTPIYRADEEMVMGGIEHEFLEEGLIVNLLAAHHETSVFSQQSYGNNNGVQKFAGGAIIPVSGFTTDASGIFSGAVQGYYDFNFGYDTSAAETETDFYEARINSVWEGPTNFLLGFNYTEAETSTIYDVYANTLDSVGLMGLPSTGGAGLYPSHYRNETNPYNLETWAGFGELYYDLAENLKITLGARYTVTEKSVADRVILFDAIALGGNGSVGTAPVGLCNLAEFQMIGAACLGTTTNPIPEPGDSRIALGIPSSFKEKEWTGRAGFDWFPEVEWSESTMVYGFYSRGYRPGAFNPPVNPALFPGTPQTVDPEYVDSFEIGMKNVMHDGQLVANLSGFYYDYQGLQISKIINRTSVNENIDAKIKGAEAEFVWTPNAWERFQLDANVSLLNTEIAGGTRSINPHNPNNGDSQGFVLKDISSAANCVVDRDEYIAVIAAATPTATGLDVDGDGAGDILPIPGTTSTNGIDADPAGLPTLASCAKVGDTANGGTASGLVDATYAADVSGNKLPQSPPVTFHVGAQYIHPFPDFALEVLFRADYYWQDEMYSRIYNTPKDRIESWSNVNAQILIQSVENPWYIRLWAQNLTEEDNITGHYFTDPSSGLFRNDFLTDPRMFGVTFGAKL